MFIFILLAVILIFLFLSEGDVESAANVVKWGLALFIIVVMLCIATRKSR